MCGDRAAARTGDLLWLDKTRRVTSGAVVDADSVLVALNIDRNLVALRSDKKGYLELARYRVAESATWAMTAIPAVRPARAKTTGNAPFNLPSNMVFITPSTKDTTSTEIAPTAIDCPAVKTVAALTVDATNEIGTGELAAASCASAASVAAP